MTLTWSNPVDDFAYLQIRRAEMPVTPDTGDVVYEGADTNSYLDQGLTNGHIYHYGFIVYDAAGNHSEVVDAVAVLPAPDELVEFPDAGLATAVRAALGLSPSDNIRALDLLRLTELDASDRDVSDLAGLRWCVNLTSVDLSGNQLTDSLDAQVTQLPNLSQLDISGNRLASMPNLATSRHLWKLSVADNAALTSVGTVAAIPSLASLDLSGTGVTELTALAPATGLESLSLMNTEISDLAPLSGFTQLQTLTLTGSAVKDLEPLMGLTALETLAAAQEGIEDVSPLALLPNLVHVNLAENQIHDLQGLVDNVDFGVSDQLNLIGNPLLHEAVTEQIPALQGRGVEVSLSPEALQLPVALVGVWGDPRVTVNGSTVDPASFFEWDPGSVDMHLSLYFDRSYLAEELDAAGAVRYFDSGAASSEGDGLLLQMQDDNGTLVDPPEDVIEGAWTATAHSFTLTVTDGTDVSVLTWTRVR
ncbi:MAG: leucine-rich repeat domain-containing protein [Deltaproteobacteria bacterium]|nr:leucine-rich repeat domain-containing protein [Deltaproteobacteria bacterium]